MAMGSGKGAITDINVTPLVDVCLVLVIIFMVISPFAMEAGIEIGTSRQGMLKAKAAFKENVNIVLSGEGVVKINGRKVEWEDLGEAIQKALSQSPDKLVSLNASPQALTGQVVEILDVSKQNGARRLAILNP